MSATSQKLNRFCKRILTALALPAIIATFGPASARADASDGISGAIFTTTSSGTTVNKNIYDDCAHVYLNGGPQNANDAGLKPFGIYYFQVTVPGWKPDDGATGLLSTDNAECRQVLVGDDGSGHGVITGVVASAGCEHALGVFNPANGNTPVQLFPFSSTPNPGGEYKAWLIRADLATISATDPKVLVFSESDAKTDNFKCGDHLVDCAPGKKVCIACPLDINAPCPLNASGVVVNYDAPTVTGAADPTVICSQASGTVFTEGTTLVTCTVTDVFGNDNCSFNVTVGHCPQCALSCPPSITNCTDSGTCTFVYNFLPLSCPDAPGVTITCTNQSGTGVTPGFAFPLGTNTVTCTASEAIPGSPCTFTVVVKDCVGPSITCPSASFDLGCNPTLPNCALAQTKVSGVTDICDPNPTLDCVAGGVQNDTSCTRSQVFDVTAKDASGNPSATCHVTFTWTVDNNPPAITCPDAKNVQCETFKPVTSDTSISLTDFKALGGTISDDCSDPTLTYKDSGPVGDCPKVYTRTYTATDGCTHTATCTQKINCFCASLVTDTARCTLLQPCDSGPGFRLIFTQDPLNLSCYKLTASNPGQFYYNAFHVGDPAQAVTFTVTLTYPFVTQGANPIEVYDSAGFSTANGQTCFTPGTKILPLSTQVTLATYGANPVVGVTTTTITVPVPAAVNDTGFVWLAVHLDYGLKGLSFGQNTTTLAATQCGGTTVLIPNNQTYTFSVSNGSAGSSSIKSCNTFKKLPGIGGLVCNSVTTRMMSGVPAVLKDSTGKVLATGTTDQDGWYMCTYKWAGKAVTLYVTITPSGYKAQTKSVTLKSNGYAEVDFTCP